MVVVAVPPKYAFWNTENLEEDASRNVWRPVRAFVLVRLRPSVPVVLIGPPVSVLSVLTCVTVPLPLPETER